MRPCLQLKVPLNFHIVLIMKNIFHCLHVNTIHESNMEKLSSGVERGFFLELSGKILQVKQMQILLSSNTEQNISHLKEFVPETGSEPFRDSMY